MLTPTHSFKSAIAFSGVLLMSMAITENVVDLEGGRAVKAVALEKLKSKKARGPRG